MGHLMILQKKYFLLGWGTLCNPVRMNLAIDYRSTALVSLFYSIVFIVFFQQTICLN